MFNNGTVGSAEPSGEIGRQRSERRESKPLGLNLDHGIIRRQRKKNLDLFQAKVSNPPFDTKAEVAEKERRKP